MVYSVSDSPLGHKTEYISVYSPDLLFAIERSQSRSMLGLTNNELPFFGVDVWTGYELSWLDERGKPVVATAEFFVPCESDCIVESKSFKLYLNSFNQSRFRSVEEVKKILLKDLSRVIGLPIEARLETLTQQMANVSASMGGICLDDLSIDCSVYSPFPEYLTVDPTRAIQEQLYTNLLKTNCPVTGQPDWASLQIDYQGPEIDRENLLRYIVSFREHQDFHEHCVERIFMDIVSRCQPNYLTVYARYTRRGGLDINPFRTTDPKARPPQYRLVRQ